MAPIFDCGAALLSDLEDFPLDVPVDVALRKVKSKPFSTSFKKHFKQCSLPLICDLILTYVFPSFFSHGLANAGIRLRIEEQDNQATNFFDR